MGNLQGTCHKVFSLHLLLAQLGLPLYLSLSSGVSKQEPTPGHQADLSLNVVTGALTSGSRPFRVIWAANKRLFFQNALYQKEPINISLEVEPPRVGWSRRPVSLLCYP